MKPIILEGDELDYWKEHSQLIKDLSEWEEDGKLVIPHDLFPNLTDDEFDFLKKFFRMKSIHFTNSKKYGRFIYNIKSMKNDKRAREILDYIMYGKSMKNVEKLFSKTVKPKVNNYYNNFYNSNSNNNNNNNNNSISWKKKKYQTNIKINNNNNRIPYAKSKTLKKKK